MVISHTETEAGSKIILRWEEPDCSQLLGQFSSYDYIITGDNGKQLQARQNLGGVALDDLVVVFK